MQTPEDDSYKLLPDGRMVFTAAYLLRRGYCCGNGCLHCPYEYRNVPQPRREELIAQKHRREQDEHQQ